MFRKKLAHTLTSHPISPYIPNGHQFWSWKTKFLFISLSLPSFLAHKLSNFHIVFFSWSISLKMVMDSLLQDFGHYSIFILPHHGTSNTINQPIHLLNSNIPIDLLQIFFFWTYRVEQPKLWKFMVGRGLYLKRNLPKLSSSSKTLIGSKNNQIKKDL